MDGAERVAEVGSWEWFPETRELVWSDNLYRLYGLEPGEVTPTAELALDLTHPDDRTRVERVLAFLGHEGHLAPVEYRIVLAGSEARRLRSTITAVHAPDGGVRSVAGVVQDVTDEVGADHKIASHIAVSGALDAWESLPDGALRLLGDLALSLEFHAGTLWVPAGDALVARAVWTDPMHGAAGFASATRKLRLLRGVCLPGQVWELGAAISVVDVRQHSTYGRRDAAARAGLRGAVAFPALHGDEVLAVLELNSREAAELGAGLMLSLRAVGSEVGRFLAHRRGELAPVVLTPRQLEVLQLAAQGCSGREIAKRLFISPTTVKSHLESAYVALGVSGRAAAVAEAMRHGLIE